MIPRFLLKKMGRMVISVTTQRIQEVVGMLRIINILVWDKLRFTNV